MLIDVNSILRIDLERDPAASGLKPAKLLALFVVDTNETELDDPIWEPKFDGRADMRERQSGRAPSA